MEPRQITPISRVKLSQLYIFFWPFIVAPVPPFHSFSTIYDWPQCPSSGADCWDVKKWPPSDSGKVEVYYGIRHFWLLVFFGGRGAYHFWWEANQGIQPFSLGCPAGTGCRLLHPYVSRLDISPLNRWNFNQLTNDRYDHFQPDTLVLQRIHH